jgi:hypothetical protein
MKPIEKTLSGTVLAFCLAVWQAGAEPLKQWTLRHPLPTVNTLYDVFSTGSSLMAVGELGTILTSTDAQTWQPQVSGSTDDLVGIARGNGVYVVVGSLDLLTSPDGVHWTVTDGGFGGFATAVAFGNGLFVAVDDAGGIYTSTTGTTWIQRRDPGFTNALYDVAFAANLFVTVGTTDNGASSLILSSTDGITWTQSRKVADEELYSVAYGASRFVAVGGYYDNLGNPYDRVVTSSSGTSWSGQTGITPDFLHAVSYGPAGFVAVGEERQMLFSATGTSWSLNASGGADWLNGVAYGAGQYVAVGETGAIVVSATGQDWHPNFGVTADFNDVCYGNGLFVAVADDFGTAKVLVSTNGVSWANVYAQLDFTLNAVCFGAGEFVAVGYETDDNGDSKTLILVSYDGLAWTRQSRTTLYEELFGVSYGVIGGTGYFAAVGDNYNATHPTVVLTAPAGSSSWSFRSSSNSDDTLYGIAYGNNAFVAVGDFGTVLRATSIGTWTPQTSGSSASLVSLAFGGGTFVAGGNGGTLLTSTTGTAWSPTSSGTTQDIEMVRYLGSRFYAGTANDALLSSTTGGGWSSLNLPAYASIAGAATSGGLTVLTGLGDSVLVSSNGVDFTWGNLDPRVDLTAVTHGDKWVVASAQGDLFTSFDGVNWAWDPTGFPPGIRGLAFTAGKYVAVGDSGTILASSNAAAWIPVTSGTTAGFKAAAGAFGRFIAVGDRGQVAAFVGGAAWSFGSTGVTNNLAVVAIAPGLFVGGGDKGTLSLSTDGLTWARASSPTTNAIVSLAWGAGRFVGIDSAGALIGSTDGVHWQLRTSVFAGSPRTVSFGAGTFLAAGFSSYISVDGVNWQEVPLPATQSVRAARFSDGHWLAVGDEGTILQSEGLNSPSWLAVSKPSPSPVLQLTVISDTAPSVFLEKASSLSPGNWQPWQSVLLTDGLAMLQDSVPTGPGQNFYRARDVQ